MLEGRWVKPEPIAYRGKETLVKSQIVSIKLNNINKTLKTYHKICNDPFQLYQIPFLADPRYGRNE